MSRKSRFSETEKMSAIMRYQTGHESLESIAEDIGVDYQSIRNWVRLYETFGQEGLNNVRTNTVYSESCKRSAVEMYLDGGCSQAEVCRKFKIRAVRTLQCWIEEYNRVEQLSKIIHTKPPVVRKQPSPEGDSSGEHTMPIKTQIPHSMKLDAVSYCISREYNYQETAEKFGVSYHQIYTWVKKYEKTGPQGLVDRRGRRKKPADMSEIDELKAEIRLLRAENQRKDLEIEALKKAQALGRRWS